MARVQGGFSTRRYHKKVLKLAKGYFGSKHRLYKTANEQVMKSLAYSYRDRRNKKRDFRKLWITRINAACNQLGISYSKFMYGLRIEGIEINRKMLSEIAITDPKAFESLVVTAKKALQSGKKPVEKAPVEKAPKIKVSEKEDGKVLVAVEAPVKEKKVTKKAVVKKEAVEKTAPKKPVVKKEVKEKEIVVEDKKPTVKKTTKKVEEETAKEKKTTTTKKKTTVKKEVKEKVTDKEKKPAAKKTVKKTTKKVAE